MINFRYHVVSIVAVFLALAIGIVLGATELQGTAIDALNKTSNSLSGDLNASHAQDRALQQQLTAAEAFAQASQARLLAGLLDNQRVVLVAAPGAAATVINGVTAAVRQAGATVTGQVTLQPKLLDANPNNEQFLSSLVEQLMLPGSAAPNGTGLQQAAQVLGSAILTKTDPSNPDSGSTGGSAGGSSDSATLRQNVLSGYAQAGLLSVSGPLSSSQTAVAATLAVVVAPASVPPGGVSDPANVGLITLAQQLSGAGLGTVMAGSASGSAAGGAINALRASSAAGQISSVDDADTVIGQIVTVQALQQALTGHKGGSYGQQPDSSSAGPSPAPTPDTSTPATTSVTRSKTDARHSTKSSGGRA